jgi:hypothetical protein
MLVDVVESGVPIGFEITTPTQVTAEQLNALLRQCCLAPMTPEDLSPLQTA